jgi:DNA-binding NarL/FixJ family response regulator
MLVEDHTVMREALHSLLESKEDLLVVGEASSGREALSIAEQTAPDVIILDINIPELNGIDVTRQLTYRSPQARILGLSVHEKGRMVTEMIKAGASGYVPKSCASRELLDGIRTVASGKMYISPQVLGDVVESGMRPPSDEKDNIFSALSEREREVLQLIAEGHSTKEIGDVLCLSVPTIHTHRQNIMKKLKARSIADLVRYAIREGIVSSDV